MFYKKENGWKGVVEAEKKNIFEFSEGYKKFLDIGKTEREFVSRGVELAEFFGFKNAANFKELKTGDKVYYNNRGKNLVLAIIGKKNITEGINYVVSHIDSPRLDLKQNPLYEEMELSYMRTHYYGGIKKYHWATLPLAMHGIVVLENGKKVEIVIGEKESDPVFNIPDLLPHLWGKTQAERKAPEVLMGEELQIIVGTIPATIENKEIKDLVKYTVMKKLNEDYGIVEEDFISAELQLVPAGKARDVGLDRSIVGAYGQDDRICGYTSLKAILDLKDIPEKTAVCFLADKEETGSNGSTGLQSDYIEYFTSDMISKNNEKYSDLDLRQCLWNSKAMSSDVNVAADPIFKSVHEMQNAAELNYGIVVTKYTGSRGKSGTNDADAEYVAEIRTLLNRENIRWQTGMLGKVDEGGGGTVAMFLAQKGIRTIDVGPALLSMHAPFELASKFDIYETYKAYKAFYNL